MGGKPRRKYLDQADEIELVNELQERFEWSWAKLTKKQREDPCMSFNMTTGVGRTWQEVTARIHDDSPLAVGLREYKDGR